MSSALPSLDNESVSNEFFAGFVQRISRSPAPLLHNGPSHPEITVVGAAKLGKEVDQQLDAFRAQLCIRLALEDSVRHRYETPNIGSALGAPTFVDHRRLFTLSRGINPGLNPCLHFIGNPANRTQS